MTRSSSLICAVSASLLLGACDRLDCSSTPVKWKEILETTGPLPEYEAALATIGKSMSLDEFKVLWERYRVGDKGLLQSIGERDEKLAETLFLFGSQVDGAADRDEVLKDAFTHYIINTFKPVGKLAAPGPQRLAQSYAQTLCIPIEDDLLPDAAEDSLDELREAGIEINRARYGRRDVLPTTMFKFEHGKEDYRKSNAVWMAEMAALAYHPPKVVEAQLEQWGYSVGFEWIQGGESGTQGFVVANDRHVIVSFRGTSSVMDLKVDLSSVRKPEKDSNGRVHSGFQSAVDEVWSEDVEPAVASMLGEKDLYVGGHSLGAALAQLAAYRLTVRTKHRVNAVYAFGSPLVGDARFVEAYDDLLGARTFSHINYEDLVTSVPPRWLGFRRLGMSSTRKFTGTGHKLVLLRDLPRNDSQESGRELEIAADGSVQLEGWADKAYQDDYENVGDSLERTTAYLEKKKDKQSGPPLISYNTTFREGRLDDHGIYEYLFKLACANVEDHAEKYGIAAKDLGRSTRP